jgi:hypothetical protein
MDINDIYGILPKARGLLSGPAVERVPPQAGEFPDFYPKAMLQG